MAKTALKLEKIVIYGVAKPSFLCCSYWAGASVGSLGSCLFGGLFLTRARSKKPTGTENLRSAKQHTAIVPTSPYTSPVHVDDPSATNGKVTIAGHQQYERIQKISAELFATRGYRAVGVAEIGEAVGLGRGALYYHISSKEDLLFGIVVRYIENLVVAGREALESEPDPRKRIFLLSRQLMQIIFANLFEMTVCFREADCLTGQRHQIVSKLHQSYQDIWTTTLREGEKKGYFRALPSVGIKGILGMYFYSFLWLKPGGRQSYKDIADIFADMTLSIVEKRDR